MDYSQLLEAIKKDDEQVIQKHVNVLTKILLKYLTVRLGASYEDARDCIQNVFLSLLDKVRNDKITHPDALLSYVFTSVRHDYYKRVEKHKEVLDEHIDRNVDQATDQLQLLVDEERQHALDDCINELKPKQKEYIAYWFNNPGLEAADVAKKFKISVNNAWTKKHRIIKILQQCVQSKINL